MMSLKESPMVLDKNRLVVFIAFLQLIINYAFKKASIRWMRLFLMEGKFYFNWTLRYCSEKAPEKWRQD